MRNVGRPKRSLLQLYVEKAAFSGVAEPVFLEVVLAERLERDLGLRRQHAVDLVELVGDDR